MPHGTFLPFWQYFTCAGKVIAFRYAHAKNDHKTATIISQDYYETITRFYADNR